MAKRSVGGKQDWERRPGLDHIGRRGSWQKVRVHSKGGGSGWRVSSGEVTRSDWSVKRTLGAVH